jgi:YgiT-type zinc finger domain-containing protein
LTPAIYEFATDSHPIAIAGTYTGADWRRQMPATAPLNWGTCPCSGRYEQRVVEIKMTVNGEAVVLKDVFQGACPNCGSRIYKTGQLQRIEETMKGAPLDGRLASAGH